MADSDGDTDVGAGRAQTSGTPRWVKVAGLITIIVIVLFVLLFVVRGPGGHGPGRHTSLSAVAAPGAPQP